MSGFAVSGRGATSDLAPVEVYVEAGCPYSQAFMKDLRDVMEDSKFATNTALAVVFWGNSSAVESWGRYEAHVAVVRPQGMTARRR